MKTNELKNILSEIGEDLEIVFMSSENTGGYTYQNKPSVGLRIVHVNICDIDDERIYIKEDDLDNYCDEVTWNLETEIGWEELEEMYEKEKWEKVLLIELDD